MGLINGTMNVDTKYSSETHFGLSRCLAQKIMLVIKVQFVLIDLGQRAVVK